MPNLFPRDKMDLLIDLWAIISVICVILSYTLGVIQILAK